MLLNKAIRDWSRTHHGPRVQALAISHIADQIDLFEAIGGGGEKNVNYSLDDVLCECKELCTPDVSISTLHRWWKTYLEWGELPFEVKKKANDTEDENNGANSINQ